MAVATVTKITAASSKSFDDAVQEGLQRASKTLRGITGSTSSNRRPVSREGKSRNTA